MQGLSSSLDALWLATQGQGLGVEDCAELAGGGGFSLFLLQSGVGPNPTMRQSEKIILGSF